MARFFLKLSVFCLLSVWFGVWARADNSAEIGKQLYLNAGGYGCQVCHGQFGHGAGQAGGNVRGAGLAQIEQAIKEQPTMQLLASELTPQDLNHLAEYLTELGRHEYLAIQVEEAVLQVPDASTLATDMVDLIFTNQGFTEVFLDLHEMGLPSIKLNPLESKMLPWLRKPGSYSVPGYDQPIVINQGQGKDSND